MISDKNLKLRIELISPFFLALWLTIPNLLVFSSLISAIIQEIVFLLGIFIYFFVFGLKFYRISNINLLVFFAFFIPIVFSFLFNLDKPIILISALNFLIFAYVLAIFSQIKPNIFFDGFRYYSIFNFLILLILYFIFSSSSQGRILIEGVQPNYIGLVCLTVALTSVLIKNKILMFFIYSFSLYLSYYISSRTTMLCLILLGFLLLLMKIKSYPKTLIIFCSFSILTFLLYLENILLFFNDVFMLDDSYRGVDTGFSGRSDRWEITFNYIKENILFGVGFKAGEETLGFTTDNGYISVFLELGFWGILNYLIVIIMSIIFSLKIFIHKFCSPQYLFCACVVLVFVIYCFFEQRYVNFGNPLSFMVFFSIFTLFLMNFRKASLND